MSLDAGGLAQMTYNHGSFSNGLGMPSSGFASRGKGSNIKRLSVTPPSKMNTIDENQPTQPRTSRSHLLAGLRTAPKSPAVPSSAPPDQLQHPGGLHNSRLANNDYAMPHRSPPKTATSASFPAQTMNQFNMPNSNSFYTPDQVLAPPTIQMNDDEGNPQMDPVLYKELVRTNQYLAEQQMRLQQQLINVTAAAQQFQSMNLGQVQNNFGPVSPTAGLSFYEQQLQYGLQPVVEEVPNHPGFFSVYNPMTKQTSFYNDPNYAAQQAESAPLAAANESLPYRAAASNAEPPSSASSNWRSSTPPKTTPSPPRDEPAPLPQPAAFRHRKGPSLINLERSSTLNDAGPRTGGLKSSGLPPTPMTGTFGPGQAREGEHPTRQPRGPPSLEELTAKPTTKHEGSKNFASRQRRRAIHSLVRAGKERRGAGSRGLNSSAESSEHGTPISEEIINFTNSPELDDGSSARSGSASLSGQPSLGNLRASPSIGAIGSERAEMKERSRERGSADSYSGFSVSSAELVSAASSFVDIKAEQDDGAHRRSNLAMLADAGKRRSPAF